MKLKTFIVVILSLFAAFSAKAQFCEFAGTYKCSGITKEIRTLHAEGQTGIVLEIEDYRPDAIAKLTSGSSPERKVWLAIDPDEVNDFIRMLDRSLLTYNQRMRQGGQKMELIEDIPFDGMAVCMVANFEIENGFYVEGPSNVMFWYHGKDKTFSIDQYYSADDGELINCAFRFENPQEISDLRDKLKKLAR